MTILIVDDETAVKEAIELLLDPHICPVERCLYAPNGVKALEILEREQPDVIFCDTQMPLLSGEKLLAEITRRNIQTEIIAVSGYSDFQYVRAVVQAGGVDYILKPIDADELNRAFEKAVAQVWERQQQAKRTQDSIRRRADRDLVKWLTGQRKWSGRVQDALNQVNLPDSDLRIALILFKNTRNIVDEMYDEDETKFYSVLNQNAVDCLKGNSRILPADEYLHILLFPVETVWGGATALDRLTDWLWKNMRLQSCFAYQNQPVPREELPDEMKRLEAQFLSRKLNPRSCVGERSVPIHPAQLDVPLRLLIQGQKIDKINQLITDFSRCFFEQPAITFRDVQLMTVEMNQIVQRIAHTEAYGEAGTPQPVSLWLFDRERWTQVFKDRLYALAEYANPSQINIETVYWYLQEHYAEPVSISTLTEQFYQSPQYISKRFKERYGVTIVTALTGIRMEQARILLENTDLSVRQIAERTGYEDENYFSKVFKKETNLTPKHYRQQHSKKNGGVIMREKRLRLALILIMLVCLAYLYGCTFFHNRALNPESIPESALTVREMKQEEAALVIYYGTIENADMMRQLCTDYQAETGISLSWEAADAGTTELKRKFAIEEAPDLFSIAAQDIPVWRERLADLSGQSWTSELLPAALQAATAGEKVLAWLHTWEANGIVYNKALFAQAGIESVPGTLSELWIVCKTLEKAGIQSFGESWMQFGYLAHLLAAPFAWEGAEEVSNAIANGDMGFADLRYIDNYFSFLGLTLDYGLGKQSVEYNTFYQYADFANGKMAMMKQGTWCERILRELNPELDIGLFPLPLSETAEENRLLVGTTTFLCINEDSSRREEAIRFIDWWHKNAARYLTDMGSVALPFQGTNASALGPLHRDMQTYIDRNNVYPGFGYEAWPADFHEECAEIIQSYIVEGSSKSETLGKLDTLYRSLA